MTPHVRSRTTSERGSALLLVILAAAMLSTLGLGLVVLGETEATTTWNARGAEEALHAADAMAARVVREATALASWTPMLDGSHVSSFVGALNPTTDYGEALDLTALTMRLQAEFPFPASWAGNRPVWRLVAHGPLAALAGPASARAFAFVMAWVADDGAELDGDPLSDTNGVVSILARARGVGGAQRSVRLVLARVCPGAAQRAVPAIDAATAPSCGVGHDPVVRVLSWREV